MYTDSMQTFLIETAGVRGEVVHLNRTWKAMIDGRGYPGVVREQLANALVCASLLSATVKFDGSLTMQVQGDGPLHLLVVQASSRNTLRGIARWRGRVVPGGLEQLFGQGHLAITIEPRGGKRYQGIVPLEGGSLPAAIEGYFRRSEQLPTRLWVASDLGSACGMLLQQLPDEAPDSEGWRRVSLLADTLTPRELAELEAEQLLGRLFAEEDLRVFEPDPMAFRCSCSRQRIVEVFRSFGRGEVEAALAAREPQPLEARCEFCGRAYLFDRVDVEQLFVQRVQPDGSSLLH
jgi:molecular chaperone Hsp33